MPHWNPLYKREASEASREAAWGGLEGALKWGAVAAVLGSVGHVSYPLYRNLTVQFKV